MSTKLTTADRTLWDHWKGFWFAPKDPTTLGFIRIMTGLLIIYIHLAYSLDLQAFFGKYGWYGAAQVDRERHELPWIADTFWSWNEANISVRLPDFPHRRKPVLAFIQSLPVKDSERRASIRYLDKVTLTDNNSTLEGLNLALRMRVAGDDRARLLQGLREGRQYYVVADGAGWLYLNEPHQTRPSEPLFPNFLVTAPPQDRAEAADDIVAFLAVLPTNTTDAQFVISHMMELEQRFRRAFVEFMLTLPENPTDRKKLIDYVEYWNNDPRKVLRQGNLIFSVWFHVTDPTQMAVIHALVLLIMVLFTVGFCTRVTSVLTWIAAVGYIHRTQQILFGMDTMMNILLIYLMIGNSGAALSIDRLFARYRAVRASLRRSGTIDPATRAFLTNAPASTGAGLGIRLIQIHFCFIYMAAGLSKLKGNAWWNGTAFWDVMANPEFTLIRYEWYEHMLRRMIDIKPFYYFSIMFGVWFTLFLEISLPFLVWTRCRAVMVWLAVLLHAGIGMFMGLNLFQLLMMTMLLSYMPTGVIRDRLRGGANLPKLTAGCNPTVDSNAHTLAVILAADTDSQVNPDFKQGKDLKELPVVTPAGGTATTGQPAIATLFNNLRLLGPFRWVLWIPGVKGMLARWLFPTAAGTPPTGDGTVAGPQKPATAS